MLKITKQQNRETMVPSTLGISLNYGGLTNKKEIKTKKKLWVFRMSIKPLETGCSLSGDSAENGINRSRT